MRLSLTNGQKIVSCGEPLEMWEYRTAGGFKGGVSVALDQIPVCRNVEIGDKGTRHTSGLIKYLKMLSSLGSAPSLATISDLDQF